MLYESTCFGDISILCLITVPSNLKFNKRALYIKHPLKHFCWITQAVVLEMVASRTSLSPYPRHIIYVGTWYNIITLFPNRVVT